MRRRSVREAALRSAKDTRQVYFHTSRLDSQAKLKQRDHPVSLPPPKYRISLLYNITDNERVILEVEKIIQNITEPFYQDNTRKEKAWSLITGVLGVEGRY